jgi:hypothetical protein
MKTARQKLRGTILRVSVVWVLVASRPSPADASGVDSLRVYALEGATFDYVFKGVSGELDGQPVLALNHRSGQTFFVRIGDPVGTYQVREFIQVTNQVFRPSLNAYMPQVASRLVLARGDEMLVLEQDKRLPRPGWAAGVICLKTTAKWQVKPGDVIEVGDGWVRIAAISDTAVKIVESGTGERFLPMISPDERAQVSETLRLRREEAEQRLLQARTRPAAGLTEPEPPAESAVFPGPVDETAYLRRRALGAATPTVMFVGEEYRVPQDYRFLPAVVGPNGQVIRPVTVLPMRFETRFRGVLVRSP